MNNLNLSWCNGKNNGFLMERTMDSSWKEQWIPKMKVSHMSLY